MVGFDSELGGAKVGRHNIANSHNFMHDTPSLAEASKDSLPEDAFRIGGAVHMPNYCFQIDGKRPSKKTQK
jgi:hypothetical protein